MLNSESKLLDGIARAAGDAAGFANSIRQQIKEDLMLWINEKLIDMDLVRREELERLELKLEKSQDEVAALEARISAIEGKK